MSEPRRPEWLWTGVGHVLGFCWFAAVVSGAVWGVIALVRWLGTDSFWSSCVVSIAVDLPALVVIFLVAAGGWAGIWSLATGREPTPKPAGGSAPDGGLADALQEDRPRCPHCGFKTWWDGAKCNHCGHRGHTGPRPRRPHRPRA